MWGPMLRTLGSGRRYIKYLTLGLAHLLFVGDDKCMDVLAYINRCSVWKLLPGVGPQSDIRLASCQQPV